MDKAPDMHIWTDGDGDTVVGVNPPLIPWPELDELLADRYPLASIEPSVVKEGQA